KPPLQGYRLVEGRYRSIPAEPDGSLHSLVTGLILRPEADSRLRMVDAGTGEPVLTDSEIADRLEAAEAELARLRREG
ncbi:MAG TPA: Uma2 family endonuclease, partial [Thermoanaerobaculia bacterium]